MTERGKYDSFTFGSPKIMIRDGDGNLIEFDGSDVFDDPIEFEADSGDSFDPEMALDMNLDNGKVITGYVKHSVAMAFERGEIEELEIRPGESAEAYLAEMGLDKGVLKLRKNKVRESDFE